MKDKIIQEVKNLLIQQVDLPLNPEDIKAEEPLFGEGLGLDSIDSLEIIVGLEKEYGLKLSEEEMEVLYSVDTISARVLDHLGEQK